MEEEKIDRYETKSPKTAQERANISSTFLHWTKFPMCLPLWLANTARCLDKLHLQYRDQTLKIKQLTLSFLLPKCHSVNPSSCSPKANLARAQCSLHTGHVQVHSLTPEQISLSSQERFLIHIWPNPVEQHQALLSPHTMPYSPRLWNVALSVPPTQAGSQAWYWRLNSHLHS